MKKNLLIYLLTIAMTATTVSCDDEFLDQTPTDAVAAESATATTGSLFLIVNGIHRLMYTRQNSNGRGGYSAMMIHNDALGEDLVMNARANSWWINMASWNDHTNEADNDTRHPWRVLYKVINNANIIIEGAEGAVGPEEERNAALGQALAYRAFAHFRMVQLYGERYDPSGANEQLGIPLVITKSTNASEGQPRATVAAVYTQINEDLDEAITLLEGYDRPNTSHIDQSVAQGMKARIALVQGNYEVAWEMAIAARDGYELMDSTTYTSGFNDYTNDEWMWGGFYNEEQGSAFTNFMAWMSRNFSSSNIRGNPKSINSTLYDMIPKTDVRSAVFDPTGEHPNLPAGIEISSRHKRFPYTNQKFLAYGTGDSRGDVPYMRAAEMYLIEAEAKARLDETGAAEALFELAVNRDPAYTLSSNTGQSLIDEILIQRRWELWGEGFRFNDLKRLNAPLDRTGANHNASLINNLLEIPAGDPRWQWKIPLDELNANPAIQSQNP
ncbi:RagB/SusD family nutrient uptake outer membrane protein [Fulvivirga sp. M361]|uniref:RagB/SusD family nutrient uptake outer membrane protein n=1 Tax=Fulvivirga sp. M361 TaxID=2594266 RepID=UPI00117A25E4|nr:RagB/SusD family nutrient uptake outer membrane protein [Fulvivirga sp. M361]TRX61719.1 RagB/SusD family nutrient uptake outer membrane protein [Fulvivirga sp. M361]